MLRIYPVAVQLICESAPLIEAIARFDADQARQLRRSIKSVARKSKRPARLRGPLRECLMLAVYRKKVNFSPAPALALRSFSSLPASSTSSEVFSARCFTRSRYSFSA